MKGISSLTLLLPVYCACAITRHETSRHTLHYIITTFDTHIILIPISEPDPISQVPFPSLHQASALWGPVRVHSPRWPPRYMAYSPCLGVASYSEVHCIHLLVGCNLNFAVAVVDWFVGDHTVVVGGYSGFLVEHHMIVDEVGSFAEVVIVRWDRN